MTCNLPDLEEMLTRAKIEHCTRPCPEHGRHEVKNGKIIDQSTTQL